MLSASHNHGLMSLVDSFFFFVTLSGHDVWYDWKSSDYKLEGLDFSPGSDTK